MSSPNHLETKAEVRQWHCGHWHSVAAQEAVQKLVVGGRKGGIDMVHLERCDLLRAIDGEFFGDLEKVMENKISPSGL